MPDHLFLIFIALLAAVLAQEGTARTLVASIFVGAAVMHDAALGSADGFAYYGSAAAFDLAAVYLIGRVRPVTDLARNLQVVCLASICVNLVGWVGWRLYWPPMGYNLAFIGVYGWALVVLLTRERTDVELGHRTVDRRRPGFRGHHRPRGFYHHRHEGGE